MEEWIKVCSSLCLNNIATDKNVLNRLMNINDLSDSHH